MSHSRLLLLTACIFIGTTTPALGIDKGIAKTTVRQFNEAPRAIREGHLLLSTNYVEHEGQSYAYYLPRKFARLAKGGQTFTIRKVDYKDEHLVVSMETDRGIRSEWTLYDIGRISQPLVDSVFPKTLRVLFDFLEPPEQPAYVGNVSSKMLHLGTCNHLPAPSERVHFGSLLAADGYRHCAICFSLVDILPLEGYSQLREESLEAARLFEVTFAPVDDDLAQGKLQERGETMLSRFPIPLKGFDYSFKVVRSELPNATAFPTGFVYITDKLLDAIEDPAELSFVLAHEIAHIELYRNLSIPYTLPEALEYFNRRRLAERTSDMIAFLFVVKNDARPDVVDRAMRVLHKLEFARESRPTLEEDPFSTHPSIRSRIAFFDPTKYVVSTLQRSFCAVDETGEPIVKMQILGKAKTERATLVYILIATTDYMGKLNMSRTMPMGGGRRGNGRIVDDTGKSFILRVDEDSRQEILEKDLILATFSLSQRHFDELDLTTVQGLELAGVSSATEWTACDE